MLGDGQIRVGVGEPVVTDGVGDGVTVIVTVGDGVMPPVGVGTGTGITVGPVLGSGVDSVGSGAGAGSFVVGALGFGARLVESSLGAVEAPRFVAVVLDRDGMAVTLTEGEALGVVAGGAMGGTVF